MRLRVFIFLSLLCAITIPGCSLDSDGMRDGYYSARALSFNNSGWEEFITLYIHNNRIITVEYNARNASGLILTWDVLYMRKIKEKMGVHPNQILREYSRELLNRQDPKSVRKVHGDTYFYETFRKLAAAAVKQAEAGNKAVAEISLTESAAPSQ